MQGGSGTLKYASSQTKCWAVRNYASTSCILHVCNVYAVCPICNPGVLLSYIPSTYLSMCICASPRAINQSIITSRQMAPKISLTAPLHHCIRVFRKFFPNETDPHQGMYLLCSYTWWVHIPIIAINIDMWPDQYFKALYKERSLSFLKGVCSFFQLASHNHCTPQSLKICICTRRLCKMLLNFQAAQASTNFQLSCPDPSENASDGEFPRQRS